MFLAQAMGGATLEINTHNAPSKSQECNQRKNMNNDKQ